MFTDGCLRFFTRETRDLPATEQARSTSGCGRSTQSGAGGIDLRSPAAILGRLAETTYPATAEISADRSARTHTPSRAPVFETERRCTAKYL